MKSDFNHKAVLYLGNSQKTALTILGLPTGKSILYSEMMNVNYDVWAYGANKLYFLNGELVEFELNTSDFAIGKNFAYPIKVGQPLLGIYNIGSYTVENGPGTYRDMPYGSIAYCSIKNGTKFTDYAIEILANSSGNIFNIKLLRTN